MLTIVKNPHTADRVDGHFRKLLSILDSSSFDLVLQEIMATAKEDVAAVKSLQIATDAVAEGEPHIDVANDRE